MNMTHKVRLGVTLVLSLLMSVDLEAKQGVQFAGIAFVGGKADSEATMPYITTALAGSGLLMANQKLLAAVSQINREDIVFLTGGEGAASVNSGGALATALAISAESFRDNRTSIENTMKLSIRAQILTFDFTNKRIISAFPVYSATVKIYDDTTDMEALRLELVMKTLIGNEEDPGKSVFDKAAEKLQSLTFKEGWNVNLQVRTITINPPAAVILAANAIPERAYKRWFAASFSSAISDFHDIPVLPYTQGQAVNAMRLRFDEGNDISFSLPPPDFVVDLVARGFATKVLGSTTATITKSHGVGMEVGFVDAAFNNTYFSENMQMGRVVEYNKKTQVSEWPIYEEVQLVLISELMAQLVGPEKKWVGRHIKSKRKFKEISKKMKSVDKQIIQEIKG